MFIVAQLTDARIRTRLRLSAWDEAVVRMVGSILAAWPAGPCGALPAWGG